VQSERATETERMSVGKCYRERGRQTVRQIERWSERDTQGDRERNVGYTESAYGLREQ